MFIIWRWWNVCKTHLRRKCVIRYELFKNSDCTGNVLEKVEVFFDQCNEEGEIFMWDGLCRDNIDPDETAEKGKIPLKQCVEIDPFVSPNEPGYQYLTCDKNGKARRVSGFTDSTCSSCYGSACRQELLV